jgi:hypothetical protein
MLKVAVSLDKSLHFVYPHYFTLFKFISVYAVDHQKYDCSQAASVCVFEFLFFWFADIVNRPSTESVAPSEVSMDRR